jgi:hypothetical protein
MTENMWIECIKVIPNILISLIGVIIFFTLKSTIVEKLLPSISEIKGLGIEIKLVKEKIENTVKSKAAERDLDYDLGVIKRAERNLKVANGKSVLWVDDKISSIKDEVDIYRSLKMNIDISTTTEDALEKLRNFNYDLVISDMIRDNKTDAGIAFLEEKKKMKNSTSLIFYIGALDLDRGIPTGAFGITNRLDELLHLTLDCFERKID